ncbi:MAG TPA: hypothetical protein DFS52_09980 [Myxococcales bacterium]|jgi:hypothetical protein|nr:hypothetical protein [Myxococcales bacterium]
MLGKPFCEQEALKKLTPGNLFDFENPVIPIKTGSRWYGSISREVVRRGFAIPDVPLGGARFVAPFLFVALWSDDSRYTEKLLAACGASCLRVASQRAMPRLVLPVLGGKEGMSWLWAVEKGILEQADELDEADQVVPDHIYVTDKKLD